MKGKTQMKINKAALDLIKARQCLTNKEIVDKAGVRANALSIGIKKDLQPATVGKIAKALNVSVEEIIRHPDDRELIGDGAAEAEQEAG